MTQGSDPADSIPTYADEAYDSPAAPPSFAEVPPKLIGGTLCLDFVNTFNRRTGRNERLTDFDELLLWAAAAGELDEQDVRDLRYGALADPAAAAAALAAAIELREALARLFAAAPGGDAQALAVLNGFLERAPERRRLVPEAAGYAWRIEQADADLERPLWQVLWDAAALLTSERLPRVRACAAADCGWLFLDETRNRSRRWCSMEDCGNRAKARRHYAKRKAG